MAYLKYLRFSLIILFFTFFIYGCGTTMTLLPHHEKIDSINFQIPAKIEYDGNREYLPRSIIDDQKTGGKLLVRYTYHVSYGKENSIGREVVNLYNPLSLVGFPIGEDTLVVAGKIEFIKGTEVKKEYVANCAFEKTRNLFYHGPTYSELRRTGVLAH